ncbi:hypothetical protein [Allosphingosinicella deserti]|uniref:Uncharacterized protein n=1 Tax=Allosphingosinicella deserti TaxID=2116704 RepID=A0A2P7QKL5_9SPHN|nr:hypothetical protein [Sphingomonas deserti]PSJ38480.1 hypothetical protein C7I55_18800 [Sphingomonas deserti]
MRLPLLFSTSFAPLGCTAAQPESASADGASAASLQPGQLRCIDASRVAGRRAESNIALIFELDDGRIVRNDLPQACPGVARASSFGTLAIEPRENRICQGDFVRIYDPADLPRGGIQSLPRCRLGAYTPAPR